MGWWSKCIMGGDTPYDIAGRAEDLLSKKPGYDDLLVAYVEQNHHKIDFEDPVDGRWRRMHMPGDWHDEEREVLKKLFEDYGVEAFLEDNMLRDLDGNPDLDYNEIAGPVVGLLLLSSGVAISDEMKIALIMGVHNDSWSSQDEERKAVMDAFGVMIKDYDGTPIVVNQEGLFEKISDN